MCVSVHVHVHVHVSIDMSLCFFKSFTIHFGMHIHGRKKSYFNWIYCICRMVYAVQCFDALLFLCQTDDLFPCSSIISRQNVHQRLHDMPLLSTLCFHFFSFFLFPFRVYRCTYDIYKMCPCNMITLSVCVCCVVLHVPDSKQSFSFICLNWHCAYMHST